MSSGHCSLLCIQMEKKTFYDDHGARASMYASMIIRNCMSHWLYIHEKMFEET